MPRKKNHSKSKRQKKSKEEIVDAMADCIFPEDIMLCILTRLPVKSLLRFKCVCKPWRYLFQTPNLIKMHHLLFSEDPRNEGFVIDTRFVCHDDQTLSLFRVHSSQNKLTYLEFPHPVRLFQTDIVGCCNGLLCLICPSLGDLVYLWNPAMRLSKIVEPPKLEEKEEIASLGFGYDARVDDFKVVRIVWHAGLWFQVYSAKSNSWKAIEFGQFSVLSSKTEVIVNGNPYWVVEAAEMESPRVLAWLDVTNLVFGLVPLLTLESEEEEEAQVPFVDWKGSLAALVCTKNNDFVVVWVFDCGEMIWRQNQSFGPIEMRVQRCLECSKNGKIVVECLNGELVVFDPNTGWMKKIEIGERRNRCFEIYGYNESLTYIEGMTMQE